MITRRVFPALFCPECGWNQDHPRPFILRGKWWCGICYYKKNKMVEMQEAKPAPDAEDNTREELPQ